MRQIDYFKFLKIFPEFIDVDDTNEVKLVLLNEVRKRTWRKPGIHYLLPITVFNAKLKDLQDASFFKKRYSLMNGHYHYKIVYKGEIMIDIYYLEREVFEDSFEVTYRGFNRKKSKFMSKGEIKNLKRTLLIDNMLKK